MIEGSRRARQSLRGQTRQLDPTGIASTDAAAAAGIAAEAGVSNMLESQTKGG